MQLWGAEPSPCFEERSKSHIILVRLSCSAITSPCKDVLGLLLTLNCGGPALSSVAQCGLKASALKAGGCGEPKCFV